MPIHLPNSFHDIFRPLEKDSIQPDGICCVQEVNGGKEIEACFFEDKDSIRRRVVLHFQSSEHIMPYQLTKADLFLVIHCAFVLCFVSSLI